MIRRTKIIATLGPATETRETIDKLIKGGVNFFRFNMKYNSQGWHAEKIAMIRRLSLPNTLKPGIIVDVPRGDFALDFTDFDFLALSYLKTASEITDLKSRWKKKGKNNVRVIAKIENGTAMKNLDSIIEISDAVMVARGDLAREIDFTELAYFQKNIIDRCRRARKPVIVATEMLESMTTNLFPTRAEATDVANAVFDGADALMLSQETTIGKYPIETVKTMNDIISFSENTDELRKVDIPNSDLSDEIIRAARDIAINNKEIKAVVVFTKSGSTARKISAFRLKIPIIAVSDNPEAIDYLNLSYGVNPYFKKFRGGKFDDEGSVFAEISQVFNLKKNSYCLMIHGNNWMQSGTTNNISLVKIQDYL